MAYGNGSGAPNAANLGLNGPEIPGIYPVCIRSYSGSRIGCFIVYVYQVGAQALYQLKDVTPAADSDDNNKNEGCRANDHTQ